MAGYEELERRLRYRIVGLLHSGLLKGGDRLPSIRRTARENGTDHRAVAQAYRALEEEGLVEVRAGSGVYVATTTGPGGVPGGDAPWLTEILTEGWNRRLARDEVGRLVARCAATPVRCACIESNEDSMVALAAELETGFSLAVDRVMIDPRARADEVPRSRVEAAPLVVTSVFHADVVWQAAALAGRTSIAVRLDPDFTAEVDRRLRAGPVTAVAVDPKFVARGEAYFSVTSHRTRIRFVRADRVVEEGVEVHGEEVLLTRAARRLLGLEEYHLVPPPPSMICAESAREISAAIVSHALAG